MQNLEDLKKHRLKIISVIDNLTKGLAAEYNKKNQYVLCEPTPEMKERGLTYDKDWMLKGREQIIINIGEINKTLQAEQLRLNQITRMIKDGEKVLKRHGVSLCGMGLEDHVWETVRLFPPTEVRRDENGKRIKWKERKCSVCNTVQRLGRD